jgi:phosphoglycolate phosphatase
MAKAEADEALLVGDTPWDVKAADRAGVETAAVLTGGFSAAELRDAGAIAVFESVPELRVGLDGLPVLRAG